MQDLALSLGSMAPGAADTQASRGSRSTVRTESQVQCGRENTAQRHQHPLEGHVPEWLQGMHPNLSTSSPHRQPWIGRGPTPPVSRFPPLGNIKQLVAFHVLLKVIRENQNETAVLHETTAWAAATRLTGKYWAAPYASSLLARSRARARCGVGAFAPAPAAHVRASR